MQLIKKLFGKPQTIGVGPESVQFHESDSGFGPESRNAPRRELVQVVLRDVMRRHGIPSAWIDCRILSVINRNSRPGLHVQLIVRDGIDRLLTYVPAFQTGFMEEIVRFDPGVEDWLFSLSWQFYNLGKLGNGMPDSAAWAGTTTGAAALATAPARVCKPTVAPGVVQRDVSASRQTAATAPAPHVPRANPAVTRTSTPPPAMDPAADDDLMDDLQALYAIRDAALGQGRPAPTGPSGEKDFESTHPGADDSVDPQPGRRR
jgi:hypothetical protein